MIRSLFVFAALLVAAGALSAAQLDVMDIPGTTLKDNPLGDPAARHVAVFKPDNAKDDAPLPLVIYLPGVGQFLGGRHRAGARRVVWQGHRPTGWQHARADCRRRWPFALRRQPVPQFDGHGALCRLCFRGNPAGAHGPLRLARLPSPARSSPAIPAAGTARSCSPSTSTRNSPRSWRSRPTAISR